MEGVDCAVGKLLAMRSLSSTESKFTRTWGYIIYSIQNNGFPQKLLVTNMSVPIYFYCPLFLDTRMVQDGFIFELK